MSEKREVLLPNSLALPARAKEVVVATDAAQAQAVLAARSLEAPQESLLVLGGGSNVVLPSRFDGLTLLMRIKGVTEQRPSARGHDGLRVFEVGAGESWQGFVKFCVGQGLGGGIENLTLIPGTVGAAPIQNIGAYGVEVRQFVDAVQVLDLSAPKSPLFWIEAKGCAFGYRDSLFKQQPGRWLITRVRFAVPTYEPGLEALHYAGVLEKLERLGSVRTNPAAIASAIALLRRAKLPDPRRYPNAGSFFKNPVCSDAELDALQQKLPSDRSSELASVPSWPHADGRKLAAAALIERAGFKRKRLDGIGVWYRQPLVLVNYGCGDAAAVRAFADDIQQSVRAIFGISLEQEPVQISPTGTHA